jgi:hypothetical protein
MGLQAHEMHRENEEGFSPGSISERLRISFTPLRELLHKLRPIPCDIQSQAYSAPKIRLKNRPTRVKNPGFFLALVCAGAAPAFPAGVAAGSGTTTG